MNHETEQKIETHVAAFVTALKGRFREHCSDRMLTCLLTRRLVRDSYEGEHETRALAMLAGDVNAAYSAAQPIFEAVLEHGCGAGGNGHHVAQHFGAYMNTF